MRAIGTSAIVDQRYRCKAHAYFQRIARRLHVLTGEELDQLLGAATARRRHHAGLAAEQVRWESIPRGEVRVLRGTEHQAESGGAAPEPTGADG